jgi:ribonuclease HI
MYINSTNQKSLENKTNFRSITESKGDPNTWTLFFDGSTSLEGVSVGFILKDPNGKKNLIACRLEFQCTNNIVEYEALLQGLKKVVNMKARNIKVFGDSEIVIR